MNPSLLPLFVLPEGEEGEDQQRSGPSTPTAGVPHPSFVKHLSSSRIGLLSEIQQAEIPVPPLHSRRWSNRKSQPDLAAPTPDDANPLSDCPSGDCDDASSEWSFDDVFLYDSDASEEFGDEECQPNEFETEATSTADPLPPGATPTLKLRRPRSSGALSGGRRSFKLLPFRHHRASSPSNSGSSSSSSLNSRSGSSTSPPPHRKQIRVRRVL